MQVFGPRPKKILESIKYQLPQMRNGGDKRNRTVDPLLAKQVLYQLSYTPMYLKDGGPKWARTTDLTIISRTL